MMMMLLGKCDHQENNAPRSDAVNHACLLFSGRRPTTPYVMSHVRTFAVSMPLKLSAPLRHHQLELWNLAAKPNYSLFHLLCVSVTHFLLVCVHVNPFLSFSFMYLTNE